MGYFREIPNLEYQSPFSNRLSNSSYVTAKNLFRRMKIRDDLQNIFTVFSIMFKCRYFLCVHVASVTSALSIG